MLVSRKHWFSDLTQRTAHSKRTRSSALFYKFSMAWRTSTRISSSTVTSSWATYSWPRRESSRSLISDWLENTVIYIMSVSRNSLSSLHESSGHSVVPCSWAPCQDGALLGCRWRLVCVISLILSEPTFTNRSVGCIFAELLNRGIPIF